MNSISYELLDYQKYQERINQLLCDTELQQMGLQYSSLGKTTYGYDIDCIKVGFGKKKLFLVGGTHGSEIISVDFVTQFLANVKNISAFDPNLFTIVAIPLQNPEGFTVTTSTIQNTSYNLEKEAREYYLRYRMDNLVNAMIHKINAFTRTYQGCSASIFIQALKHLFNTDSIFTLLKEERAIPQIKELIASINSIPDNLNYQELQTELLYKILTAKQQVEKQEKIDIHTILYLEVLSIFKEYFQQESLWSNMTNSHIKLHQQMFQDTKFSAIKNTNLKENIEKMYREYNHPLGSQATFDATGVGVNLNANTLNNPGIEERKKDIHSFGLGSRNNIKNHVPGPLGSATEDIWSFSYAIENKILYEELSHSYKEGSYLATLLYHGTGGMIFYKPVPELTKEENFSNFFDENKKLAECYGEYTEYRLVEESPPTGYGDYLRGQFPSVLMIELSKMGGNPLAPYGDKQNILNCYQTNFEAINNILEYYKLQIEQENAYKR